VPGIRNGSEHAPFQIFFIVEKMADVSGSSKFVYKARHEVPATQGINSQCCVTHVSAIYNTPLSPVSLPLE